MNNYLPNNDCECDERLVVVVLHYVVQKNMPLKVAKNILQVNIRRKSEFKNIWINFNKQLNTVYQ